MQIDLPQDALQTVKTQGFASIDRILKDSFNTANALDAIEQQS